MSSCEYVSPCVLVIFAYEKILIAASMCCWLGLLVNLAHMLTAKEMSGLVPLDRYRSDPIID